MSQQKGHTITHHSDTHTTRYPGVNIVLSAFTAKQRDDWVAALSHARLVSEEEDEDDSSTSVQQDELISDRSDILDRDGFVYGTIVKADTTKNLNHITYNITYNQDRPDFGPGTPSALAGVVDLENMPTQEKTCESKTSSVQLDDVDLETTSIDESTMATLPFDYKL